MNVRLAAEPDLPAINAIQNHYIRTTHIHFSTAPIPDEETLSDWRQTHDRFPCFVMPDASGILGFARASPWKSRCAYAWSVETSVYLRPNATGRGRGRALYEALFRVLHAQGYRSAIAGIALPNEPSVRLHEAMGMRHTGTFQRVGFKLGRWWDVGYWQLDLADPASPPGPILTVDAACAKLGG